MVHNFLVTIQYAIYKFTIDYKLDNKSLMQCYTICQQNWTVSFVNSKQLVQYMVEKISFYLNIFFKYYTQ
jgi:hypothetical protein